MFFLRNDDAIPAKAHKAASLPKSLLDKLPEEVRDHPLLKEKAWVKFRDEGLSALVETEMVTTPQSRAEFLMGAYLLDATVKVGGLLNSVKPQMLRVVDILGAGKFKNAVLMPRRSSKTTTLFCILLGRCALDDLHLAGFTLATTQKKTAERYRVDVYGPITRRWPDPDTRPVKLYKGNGTERVEFPNGSVLSVLSPDGDAFRSGAYDTLLVDEGGEASDEMGDDIVSSVLPAFDTRPNGQFVVAGTAADFREGNILWDMLHDPRSGKLSFTVADSVTDEQLAAWEPSDDHPEACVRDLVVAMHPGVDSGLTTLDKIEDNASTLSVGQFAREYLGVFGTVGTKSGIVNLTKWTNGGSGAALPTPPERFGLAYAPHPDQRCGSILAAWRDESGRTVLLQLEHKTGIEWMATAAARFARKYGEEITFDAGQQVASLIQERLHRSKPRPKLHPLAFADIKKAAALLIDEIDRDNVTHFRQPELDNAALLAVKRKAGINGWALGRGDAEDDITGLEAASLALYAYDQQKPKTPRRKPTIRT
ncbi:Terminase [Salinibacterium sp. NYA9b]